MSCMLRIAGKSFDVDSFFTASEWTPTDENVVSVYKIGEPEVVFKKRKNTYNGLGIQVSWASFSDFAGQQQDVIQFIKKYKNTFSLLKNYEIDAWCGFDFGLDIHPENGFSKDYLIEAELIALCGEYRLELYLSTYMMNNNKRRKARGNRLFTKKRR